MSRSRNSRARIDLRDSAPDEEMDMADTLELPAVDILPPTPAPRRVSEQDAHPAWVAAMDGLRRSFCAPSPCGPLCFCPRCLSRAEEPRS